MENIKDVKDCTIDETDIDSNYSVEDISAKVEEEMNIKPKAATKTTSFYTMIAAVLAGVIVTFLVASGIVAADESDTVKAGLIVVLDGGIVYIIGKYIDGRSAVSAIKAETVGELALAEQRGTALSGSAVGRLEVGESVQPLAGFNILGSLPMVLNLAIMALGGSTKGKKGKVVKALKAALSALAELQ
jgi:hypothetical protein